MLDQNVAREVLQEAVRTGGDFAEIFMEDRIDHAMGMRSHKLESATTSRTHGAGVRVFSGTNAIYVYTNDTSREGLMNCARQAAAAVRGGKGCVVEPFKPSWGCAPRPPCRRYALKVPAAHYMWGNCKSAAESYHRKACASLSNEGNELKNFPHSRSVNVEDCGEYIAGFDFQCYRLTSFLSVRPSR